MNSHFVLLTVSRFCKNNVNTVSLYRNMFKDLSKEEQDITILSYLEAMVRLLTLQEHYGEYTKWGTMRNRSSADDSMKRDDIRYYVVGERNVLYRLH